MKIRNGLMCCILAAGLHGSSHVCSEVARELSLSGRAPIAQSLRLYAEEDLSLVSSAGWVIDTAPRDTQRCVGACARACMCRCMRADIGSHLPESILYM